MYANGIKFNTNTGGFQKGQRSHNTYPIGAKSVDKDGFVIYKHSNSGGHHSKIGNCTIIFMGTRVWKNPRKACSHFS